MITEIFEKSPYQVLREKSRSLAKELHQGKRLDGKVWNRLARWMRKG